MLKIFKIFICLFILSVNCISHSNSGETFFNKTINNFKSLYDKIFEKELHKTIKYDLGDISQTIPYKLYLIIQELKNYQADNLFLNRLLLYGPPGNGKSTYARKIAQAINASFYENSGPSIVNSYQGSGAENVNKIFEEAIRENSITQRNVVIFIDEVDSIASKTAKRLDNKAAVQALWLNLDKIKQNSSIFVIIATNEFNDIHPTLLDRFGDNILEIKNPDDQMRKEVIEFFIQKFKLNPEKIKVKDLIKKMKGFSIRSIEDALRSIKRISNIENNGEPTEQIINDILKTHKKKPLFKDFESKIDKIQKYFDLINSTTGILATIANLVILFKSMKSSSNTEFNKSNSDFNLSDVPNLSGITSW